jgi:hypothetical protein
MSSSSGKGLCSVKASAVSAPSHWSGFLLGSQDDRHGLRVNGRNNGVGLGRQKAEQLVIALN